MAKLQMVGWQMVKLQMVKWLNRKRGACPVGLDAEHGANARFAVFI
jgi:hypothetical protein